MTTPLPFFQVDAFADEPFTGNPAAVMPLQLWPPDDVLQVAARAGAVASGTTSVPTDPAAETTPSIMLRRSSETARTHAVIANDVKEQKNANFGYNANTGEYEDMFKAGVVDPTKVTRSALQNAASVASMVLTTECLVTEVKEDKKSASTPDMSGMGGMM